MNTKLEIAHADGSGYEAVVVLQGVTWSAWYVAGQMTVRLVPARTPQRAPKWMAAHVRGWAAQQVAALGDDWHAAHRALYGL